MNKNVLLIYGLPGVGKTTIMKGFIPQMNRFEQPFVHYIKDDYCILGDFHQDNDFLGTDRLSMSIQPTAIEFIIQNPRLYFIVEGDRLFNEKFIQAVNPEILFIEATEKEVLQRREKRGADQNPQFLKSKKTKIENIKSKYAHYTIKNNDGSDIDMIRKQITELLYGTSNLVAVNPNQLGLF